jgi:hypothetical protein
MRYETVMVYFKAITQNVSVDTEDNHEIPLPMHSDSGPGPSEHKTGVTDIHLTRPIMF